MTFCIILLLCFVLIKALPIVIQAGYGEDSNLIYLRLEARGYITDLVYDQSGNIIGFSNVPIMTQLGTYLHRIFAEGDFGVGVNMPEYSAETYWTCSERIFPLQYSLTFIQRL